MKSDSRSPLLDNELCVNQAGGSRFDLVLIASERLRELRRQHKEGGRFPSSVEALLDIQKGKIDSKEYLAKAGRKNKS